MPKRSPIEVINSAFTHSVKDPLWGNVPFSKGIKKITETPEFEKLSRIKQTGPAYRIYPGAVHTRLSHSIGVYCLGRRIIETVSKKSNSEIFTETGILSFLIACLLHDIGHFPYAHSLKELSPKEHEKIAAEIILEGGELYRRIIEAGADPLLVSSIIDKDTFTDNEEALLYRSILSGPLDPDKLDYLSRDAFFAGIPYGRQDTDFIINSMSLGKTSLALDSAALSSLEQILFSKYMMYKSLYWHKGVRSATSMIKKAIVKSIKNGELSFDDLYRKDDYEFLALVDKKKGPLSLASAAEHGELYERKDYVKFSESGSEVKAILDISDREKGEAEIYRELKGKYGKLRDYDVIIDIPEPINFETSIEVLSDDGGIHELRKGEIVFSDASPLFSDSLRYVSLFLPSYVETSDAKKAFERYHG